MSNVNCQTRNDETLLLLPCFFLTLSYMYGVRGAGMLSK